MAHKVNKLLKHDDDSQKYLVIAGKGHMQHFCGVPELVLAKNGHLKEDSSLVVSAESNHIIDFGMTDDKFVEGVKQEFGPEDTKPADYLYIFEEEYEEEEEDEEAA